MEETVGARIKRIRKEKKIPVSQITDALGINRTSLYRYEKGEINKMPHTTLIPIAKILGVSPAYLLSGKEKESNNYNELINNLKKTIGDIEFSDNEITEITSYIEFIISKRKWLKWANILYI